jgi:hypothetical protein
MSIYEKKNSLSNSSLILLFLQRNKNQTVKKSTFVFFKGLNMQHGYRGVGGRVFFAKYTLNLSYKI